MSDHHKPKVEVEAIADQAAQNLAGWQRALADYENFKKEVAKNRAEEKQRLTGQIIGDFLPLIDNLRTALEHLPEEQQQQPWAIGLRHIYNDALALLKQQGVTAYQPAVGDQFDPVRHLAVATTIEADQADQAIVKVGTAGYELRGNILKPSQVVVNIKE